jgi:hypothetical protein
MNERPKKQGDLPGGFFFFLVMSPFILEGSIAVEGRLKGGRDERFVDGGRWGSRGRLQERG